MVCIGVFPGFFGSSGLSFTSLNLVSYSLDVMVSKYVACNEKVAHLQNGSCKCQYLGALGLIRLCNHPGVASWPSYNPYFGACEVNSWVKSYLKMA